jgi:hypothetical protein
MSSHVDRTACAVCALAALLVGAATATASSRDAAAKVCESFAGPSWSITGRTGTKYALETFGGYPCTTATTWAKKLAALHLTNTRPNSHSPITGPAGFSCEASPDRKGHAHTGSCRKLNAKTRTVTGFDWTLSLL